MRPRLSIDDCRAELGDEAVGLSDEQVLAIRDHLYSLADLALLIATPAAVEEALGAAISKGDVN